MNNSSYFWNTFGHTIELKMNNGRMEGLSFEISFQKSYKVTKILFIQSSENKLREKNIFVHKRIMLAA